MSSDQSIEWTREIGTSGYDNGRGVIASADGKYIYVTGFAGDSLNGQPYTGGNE
jgi:hypothetical protein